MTPSHAATELGANMERYAISVRRFSAALGLIILGACQTAAGQGACQPDDRVTFVQGDGECLAIQTYPTAGARTLVIVLHGDLSGGGGAEYIFPVAEQARDMGATAVAMMRLGYSGGGRSSTGPASRNEPRNQIYTSNEMDAIADATRRLADHHGAEEVVMIGHSGGAVMTGVILGRHPGLVDRALLLSCPCHIPDWRRARGRNPLVAAESPHEYLEAVPAETVIHLVVGAEDSNTRPFLSENYGEDAVARGLDATVTVVEGAGHNFNSDMRDSAGFQAALRAAVLGE